MAIPRGWTALEDQRSPDQTASIAEPMATDARFKVAAFLLFFAWLVILFSLRHSIHYYKPNNRGLFNRAVGIIRYTPVRFLLTIPLCLAMVGYEAAVAFDFSISPLNINGNSGWIYGLGWAPIALIFVIQEISGYLQPNEDRELIRQRRVRGAEIDSEMGYVAKPHWWRRLNGDHNLNVHEAIAKNVREVGGGAATHRNLGRSIELGNMQPKIGNQPRNADKHVASDNTPAWRASQRREDRISKSETPEAVKVAARLLFPTPSGASERSDPFADVEPEERGRLVARDIASSTTRAGGTSERSRSTASATTLNGPPQQIRSMLDI